MPTLVRAHAIPIAVTAIVLVIGLTFSPASLLALIPIVAYLLWAFTRGRARVSEELAARARPDDSAEIDIRIATEPLPAALGAGADGHMLMRWPDWADAIWHLHGGDLLERERRLISHAEQSGYAPLVPAAPDTLADMTNLHALFADQKKISTVAYPRNRMDVPVTKSGRNSVTVADYNRYTRTLDYGTPNPKLLRSTVAVARYVHGHPLIITGRTAAPGSMWSQVAGPRTPLGIPALDEAFDVYTREPAWVADMLSDDLVL